MRHLLIFIALMLASAAPSFAQKLEPVTLQLKWKHQFQFAGYYVAVEKGYYRDAGFEVKLAEAQGEDTLDAVLAGKAHYGVAGSELALRRALGDPVVALATVLQHSALALAVRGGTSLTVHDLSGRKAMLSPHDQELLAYLKREGLAGGRVQQVPQSYDINDLVTGKVDAFSVYTTDQVWQLRKAGLAYTLLSPRAGGIDFYGDTLFTTEKRARGEPERVRAFREASLRGWQYAMDHSAETVDLILARYSQRLPREHLLFEAAEMARLMQPQLIEIGHMNPGRWRHVAGVYAEIGMLPRGFSLDGFLFDDVSRGTRGPDPWLIGLGLLAAGSLAAAGWLFLRYQRLRSQVQPVVPMPAPMAEGATADDAADDLFSLDYLRRTLPRELERARREGATLQLAWLRVNEPLQPDGGPAAAGSLVRALAALVAQRSQGGDFACHAGRGELAWVLPGEASDAAAQRLRALAADFARQPVWSGLIELKGTVAWGLAAFPHDAADAQALLRIAAERVSAPNAASG
ncbi:ABC transporter substrate-binding protein [Caenimonas sedimenti]|nr:ABC transporter substrate-binding protein [Caenimonas sedimenti]